MVSVRGQRAALPGFKIHHIVADLATLERASGVQSLIQQSEIDTEASVERLSAADRLERKIHRGALLYQLECGGDVCEHAGLRRNFKARAQIVEHDEHISHAAWAIACGIDADDRVTRSEQQSVNHACCDASKIVRRMVGLEPCRKSAGQANRVAKARHDLSFGGDDHEVLQTAELTDRCDHFRCQPRRDRDENLGRRRV
jgi:hypothetical protein